MGIIKYYSRISCKEIEKLKNVKSDDELNGILEKAKEYFDIDKSWQILNFLITGEKDFSNHVFTNVIYPNNYTINLSEQEESILDEYYENGMQNETEEIRQIELKQELSQGFLSPEELGEIIPELEGIEIEQITEKVDFNTFNEIGIYPETWRNSPSDKDYVKKHYNNLLSFLHRAKLEEDCIIIN